MVKNPPANAGDASLISDPGILSSATREATTQAWMGGEFAGERIHAYDESLHSSPETIMTLLISYTPIQNNKFKKKEKLKKREATAHSN